MLPLLLADSNKSPALLNMRNTGWSRPDAKTDSVRPLGDTSIIWLLFALATNTSPALFTATPEGPLKPKPKLLTVPFGVILVMLGPVLLPTNRSPELSKVRYNPKGWVEETKVVGVPNELNVLIAPVYCSDSYRTWADAFAAMSRT